MGRNVKNLKGNNLPLILYFWNFFFILRDNFEVYVIVDSERSKLTFLFFSFFFPFLKKGKLTFLEKLQDKARWKKKRKNLISKL